MKSIDAKKKRRKHACISIVYNNQLKKKGGIGMLNIINDIKFERIATARSVQGVVQTYFR